MPEIELQQMIGKPYVVARAHSHRYICWHFCRKVYSLLGLNLKNFHLQQELKRVLSPAPRCIVLFQSGAIWHAGVVWPDGLHFIHAKTRNFFDSTDNDYFACKDRLTIWPFKHLIEGYYKP